MSIKSGYFVVAGVDMEVEYTFKPAIPGVFHRRPEDCYEDEPEEIELYSVRYHDAEFIGNESLSQGEINSLEKQISDYENDK